LKSGKGFGNAWCVLDHQLALCPYLILVLTIFVSTMLLEDIFIHILVDGFPLKEYF